MFSASIWNITHFAFVHKRIFVRSGGSEYFHSRKKLDKTFTEFYSLIVGNFRMINEIDRQILNILQGDARTSNVEIARQVGLAPSAVLERVRKLEERGVIRGYAAEVNAVDVGFGLTAFVFVRTSFCGSIGNVLAEIPEVLEVHDIAGDDCYLLKVRAENTDALGKFFREKLKNLPEIVSTRTTIVLQTIKETTALPINQTETVAKDVKAKTKTQRKKEKVRANKG